MKNLPVTHIIHGCKLNRQGSCSRCSNACCGDCSHYKEINKISTCMIYDKRNEMCTEHGETHQSCINFSTDPWLRVIKEGLCSYKFTEIKNNGFSKFEELNKQWQ